MFQPILAKANDNDNLFKHKQLLGPRCNDTCSSNDSDVCSLASTVFDGKTNYLNKC